MTLILTLCLSLPNSLVVPTPSQASQAPFTELVAAYPYGPQISLGVSPSGSRVYVAEGGAIDILNASGWPPTNPTSMDQVEFPEASPYSVLQYEYAGNQRRLLFIAGGTSGLWMAVLCTELFSTPPPAGPPVCTCAPANCDRWQRKRIDIAEYPGLVRKRCVDIAMLEGNPTAGMPLLCAIFTARNDSPGPVGPSELRTYKVLPDFSVLPVAVIPLPAPPADAAATSLVVDPSDSNSVYVALGTAWLYKVDLATQSAAPYPTVLSISSPFPDQMRDLAVVRTSTQGTFIYASLDSGRIFEYSLQAGTVTVIDLGCTFADRIAAVTDEGDKVLVGVVLQRVSGREQDASWRPGHLWTGMFLTPSLPDPNVPDDIDCSPGATASNCCGEIRFYRRDHPVGLASASPLLTVPHPDVTWGTLEMRRISSSVVRSYGCAKDTGTTLRDILNPFSTTPAPSLGPVTQYVGPGNGSGDGPVSLLNPGFPHFGGESRGINYEKRLYITPPPARILPMEDIECPPPTVGPATTGCSSISAFGGTLFGEANWLDSDGQGEWFFSGKKMMMQTYQPCTLLPSTECFATPCGPTADRFWQHGQILSAPYDNEMGWWLIYMKPVGSPPGSAPTYDSLKHRWYQIPAPTLSANEERTLSHEIITSQADPRTVSDVPGSNPYDPEQVPEIFGDTPVLIHGVRFSSHWGYKVFRTPDLLAKTHGNCGPGTPPSTPIQGVGDPLKNVPYWELLTHLEILNVGCANNDHGGDPPPALPIARNFQNTKCHVFPVTRPNGERRWVTAVAAGRVMTTDASCPWSSFSRKPMVVFHDVTATVEPSFPKPVLLRVGIGSDSAGPGIAWAVTNKTYDDDRNYVFLTDLQGRLMVFDVSGDNLFDPIAPAAAAYPPQLILRPIATLEFPRDPYDGYAPNVIDVEIDETYAYCAIGRAGIGIVDISNPELPALLEILETSGVTEGIAFRTDEQNRKQMISGDLSAGMRLWGRPGE